MSDLLEHLGLLLAVEPDTAFPSIALQLVRSPGARERLHRLERVWARARTLWPGGDSDIAKAADFMLRPHPLLFDERPVDLAMESEEGAQKVETLLGRAEHGICV